MRRALLLAGAVILGACDRPAPPPPPPPASPAPTPAPPPPKPRYVASDIARVDVHTHVEPGALPRAIKLMAGEKVTHIINLSGGVPGGFGLEDTLAEAKAVGHTTVFTNPDFREVKKGAGYGARIAAKIKAAHALGARGVKISKGLGLGVMTAKHELLPVDDKGLDPLFEMAGKLGMPIAIHTGDPKAFWLPPGPDNERWDELRVHPSWSFFKAPVSWEQLYSQFERRVARHPKTHFIGVHFGNDPEDPEHVGRMLDKYKNLYVDTAARVPEIGRVDARHDAARMRSFFEKYQDRILFGTDVGVGVAEEDLMLGSTGAEPPGPADVIRYFDSTWRWFETDEKSIPSPTPIQGRWTIDGIALPRAILEKVYRKNAEHLLGAPLD